MDAPQAGSFFPSATLPLMNWGCEVIVESFNVLGRCKELGAAPLMEGPGGPHGDAKYEAAFDVQDAEHVRKAVLDGESSLRITLVSRPQCGGGGAAHVLLRATCDRPTLEALCGRAAGARDPEATAASPQFVILQAFVVVCRPDRRRAAEAKLAVEATGDKVLLSGVQLNVPAGDAAYMSEWLGMMHGEHR
jgi:hypothetical protein